jgi:hypothetical protein
MKLDLLVVLLSAALFSQTTQADTLSLVGGTSGNWETGWWGEAWAGEHWCGDTIMRDPSPDTVVALPDTIKDFETTLSVSDTVIVTQTTQTIDSLVISTTKILTRTVLRDSVDDPVIDIINETTTITDTSIVQSCASTDFITDTGAATEGADYFDFYYRFREYYAQLPFIWKGWGGYDSLTVAPYTKLLITYKGVLPTHQVQLSFIYATWGANADTMKNVLKMGDGIGTLPATDVWNTLVFDIPDSVSMPGITGITLSVENVPDGGGADSSAVGNLKVQEISLFSSEIGIIRSKVPHGISRDKYSFTPTVAGEVALSTYSLSGALLGSVQVAVSPSQTYSVHRLVNLTKKNTVRQIRFVTIHGAGVHLIKKIW